MLSKLNFFPNTSETQNLRTISGGILTIISLIVVAFLLLSEISEYVTVTSENNLVVDGKREDLMDIHFNITLSKLPCAFFSLDAIDISGVEKLDVNSTVFKQRLNSRGKPLKKVEEVKLLTEVMEDIEVVAVPQNKFDCDSCYGAETDERKCCPTCADVRAGYKEKGWSFSNSKNIAQCKNEGFSQHLNKQRAEGCNVYGVVSVNKVGGNFHIAPGSSFSAAHNHIHDSSAFNFAEKFDLSHTIHYLSFGEKIPGKYNPLDDVAKTTTSTNSLYEYYIKVVPTEYTNVDGYTLSTNQFSVTEHYKPIDNSANSHDSHGTPGIYFIYDLSPIQINIVDKEKTFSAFFVSICAIIGGIFTIFRILDRFVYYGMKSIQEKMQIGKAY